MKAHAAFLIPFALVIAASGITADPGAYDDTAEFTGPSFTYVNEIGAFGNTVCLDNPSFPLSCDPSPGSARGFLPGEFDLSSWNSDSSKQSSREVRVWVSSYEYSGSCAVRCSFAVLACADRDDDKACSDQDDNVALGISGEPFIGDGSECDSDTKGCGDPLDAEVTLCVQEDSHLFGGYDDLVVHAGIYVEEPLFGPEGFGGVDYAMTFYDAYVEYGDWGCTPTASDVPVLVYNSEPRPSLK